MITFPASRALLIDFSPEWGGTTGARWRRDFGRRCVVARSGCGVALWSPPVAAAPEITADFFMSVSRGIPLLVAGME